MLIVDEVQSIWRPRTGGAAVPVGVSGLETHRQKGTDFWLISQGPHLFDAFIRKLVGRHVHLVARWSGRTQYEWPECREDVQSRADALQRPYVLPKHVFNLYQSAEVHTKQEQRKPLSFYAFIASIALLIIFTGLIYTRISHYFYQDQTPAIATINPASNAMAATLPITSPKPNSLADEKFYLNLTKGVLEGQLPINCSYLNSTRIKCILTFKSALTFKQSYCIANACYALFDLSPVPSPVPVASSLG